MSRFLCNWSAARDLSSLSTYLKSLKFWPAYRIAPVLYRHKEFLFWATLIRSPIVFYLNSWFESPLTYLIKLLLCWFDQIDLSKLPYFYEKKMELHFAAVSKYLPNHRNLNQYLHSTLGQSRLIFNQLS